MGVGVHADLAAHLGAGLGNGLAGTIHLLAAVLQAVDVDFDELVEALGLGHHLGHVKGHGRAAHVAKAQHLGLLQGVEVHLRSLRERRALGEGAVVDARDDKVAVLEDLVLERGDVGARGAVYLGIEHHVMAEEVAIEVHDVGLAAMQQAHALPLAGPGAVVEEVLEVAELLLGEQHAAEVVRGGQQLQPKRGGLEHVLPDGGVGVARVERMGVGVAEVLQHRFSR